ncbi:histidine phosphatase superfamily [Xylariaceae sp. FL0594]|nr:histidine phosphatase superfamily [Xylariaceae sp. FL0594]
MVNAIIEIVRHAEALHNALNDNMIRDPRLTANGIAQARALCDSYQQRSMQEVARVVSSPMRRAIMTAIHGFRPILAPSYSFRPTAAAITEKGKLRLLLVPELQESSARPSDTGSPPSELFNEFGPAVLDARRLGSDEDGWWHKDASTTFGPDPHKLVLRANKARLIIRDIAREVVAEAQSEGEGGKLENVTKRVVVVTHSAFVRYMVLGEPELGNAEVLSCRFLNLFGDDERDALLAPILHNNSEEGQGPGEEGPGPRSATPGTQLACDDDDHPLDRPFI